MATKKKYAFCKKCGKAVPKPNKKKLESFHYQILAIASIATLGFGLLGFIIYRAFIDKRIYCPNCYSEVEFYKSAEEVPGPKVPVINLLEKLEEKKEDKDKKVSPELAREFIDCENCEKEFDKDATICPFCGWKHEITT